jgi:hypothetical protein
MSSNVATKNCPQSSRPLVDAEPAPSLYLIMPGTAAALLVPPLLSLAWALSGVIAAGLNWAAGTITLLLLAAEVLTFAPLLRAW